LVGLLRHRKHDADSRCGDRRNSSKHVASASIPVSQHLERPYHWILFMRDSTLAELRLFECGTEGCKSSYNFINAGPLLRIILDHIVDQVIQKCESVKTRDEFILLNYRTLT
jgi:hypothetical protein